jgi:hypothetical protein
VHQSVASRQTSEQADVEWLWSAHDVADGANVAACLICVNKRCAPGETYHPRRSEPLSHNDTRGLQLMVGSLVGVAVLCRATLHMFGSATSPQASLTRTAIERRTDMGHSA